MRTSTTIQMGIDGPVLATRPWSRVIERVNIYGTMLWVIVFAVVLRREQEGTEALPQGNAGGPVNTHAAGLT